MALSRLSLASHSNFWGIVMTVRLKSQFAIVLGAASCLFASLSAFAALDVIYSQQAPAPVTCTPGATICGGVLSMTIWNAGPMLSFPAFSYQAVGLVFNSGSDSYLQSFSLNLANFAFPGSLSGSPGASIDVGLLAVQPFSAGPFPNSNYILYAADPGPLLAANTFVTLSAPATAVASDVLSSPASGLNWQLTPNTDYILVAKGEAGASYGWATTAAPGNAPSYLAASLFGSTTPVPEPTTYALLLAGLGCMLAAPRLRRPGHTSS